MENNENNDLHEENAYQPTDNQTQSTTPSDRAEQPYSGAGVGRKESPFADSPYVMNRDTSESQNPGQNQNPGQSQNVNQNPGQTQNINQRPYQNPYQYQYQYGYNAYQSYQQPQSAPPRGKAPRAKKKGGHRALKSVLTAVLALVVVATGCGLTAFAVNSRWEEKTDALEASFNSQIADLQEQVSNQSGSKTDSSTGSAVVGTSGESSGTLTAGEVYTQNVQSVVLITCEVTTTSYGQTQTGTASGSGFVWTTDGYIVTNHHVIEDATSITISMYDGTEYDAQLVGSDETNDVAVLKIDAQNLSCVTVGSSDALAVGDQVVAIGNPLGELTSSLTVGYVSAKDRDVSTEGTILSMIQTDVAINSGNSGGPLFNMKGEVVGITTAKYSGSTSSGATIEGIGFAIPIDDVAPLVEDLMNYGYVTGAYLGVSVTDMDEDTASYFNMPVGAYVKEVTTGYAAEAAGVQAKDIIVALGDETIESVTDLTRALRKYEAGDTTTITVYRSGAKLELTITLDEKPQTTDSDSSETEETESQVPSDGSSSDWYNYFSPFFGNSNGNG